MLVLLLCIAKASSRNDVAFDVVFLFCLLPPMAVLELAVFPSKRLSRITCLVCTVIARQVRVKSDSTGDMCRSNPLEEGNRAKKIVSNGLGLPRRSRSMLVLLLCVALALPLSLRGGTTKQNDVASDVGFLIGLLPSKGVLGLALLPTKQTVGMIYLGSTVIARQVRVKSDSTGDLCPRLHRAGKQSVGARELY